MALTAVTLLCFAALLPFPGMGVCEHSASLYEEQQLFIKVNVTNKFTKNNVFYKTIVDEGTVMFGVLNKLQDTQSFSFTYTIYKKWGIFLESVNGLSGSKESNMYWELLSCKGKEITRLNVGIGCYQPQNDETLIMNYTTGG